MKKLLIFLSIVLSLNASVLKVNELKRIENQKEKSSLEADLLKNSWINPLSLEADYTKDKSRKIKSREIKVRNLRNESR